MATTSSSTGVVGEGGSSRTLIVEPSPGHFRSPGAETINILMGSSSESDSVFGGHGHHHNHHQPDFQFHGHHHDNDEEEEDEDDLYHHRDRRPIILSSEEDAQRRRNSNPNFRKIQTVAVTSFVFGLNIAVLVLVILLPMECDDDGPHHNNSSSSSSSNDKPHFCFTETLSMLLYCHCVLWIVVMSYDQFVQFQHRKIRRRGYLEFYDEMYLSSHASFWVVTFWSTLLLIIATVLEDSCGGRSLCAQVFPVSKSMLLTICIGIETLCLCVILSYYVYQVAKFNKSRLPPDVFRTETLSCALEFDFMTNSDRQIDEELFQRQADLIRYYKDRNTILQRTVLSLNRRQQEHLQPLPPGLPPTNSTHHHHHHNYGGRVN